MCSACLTRHGDGWDVHGHPNLPWGRSRSSNPWQEGQLDTLDGRVPGLRASAATYAIGPRAD